MIGLYIFLGIVGFLWIGGILYLWLGWFKFFFHNVMGWHKPKEDEEEGFDGCSFTSHCKYCGKEIMQDSQGNWY